MQSIPIRFATATLSLLLAACASQPLPIPPAEVVCPEPEPCPVCEILECPVVEPEIIEREKIVTRTVKVPAPRPEDALSILGQTERVYVEGADVTLEARIDTGSETTAIHATNIKLFERDERDYVRFTIPGGEGHDAVKQELRLRRKVSSKDGNGESSQRYVVRMWLQLGKIRERVDVTLLGKNDIDAAMMIGRNFLTDNALVDVSGSFLVKTNGKAKKP